MADRTIVVRLRAEVADLKAKMAEAAKSTEDFGKRAGSAIEKNSAHITTLSNQAGLLGVAMVAAAAVAVKAFADFDQSMSNVQAATRESAENMALLRDASLEAGARTVFSATEAAGAVEELAKAGISTADILGGALDGALDLAAAGGLGVAEAAGIAAVSMQQFGLEGDQAAHVADLLAAGAGKAMGDVTDFGAALAQAGLVANSTGLSIEETTAGLAAFASAGLIGSDAGTSFKAMLQRLTPQSGEAKAEMDRLGISAYDASGEFIGLAEFSGQLQTALRDLTPEQRNAALATIFGSDAVRAANVLYTEGEQGIRDWTAAVDDQGYAAETAALRMDNLKGDIEQLGGAIETALIGLGEGADGPLRELVQSVTDVVNAFAGAPDAVQSVLLALVGGGGLVLLGVAGLGKLVIGINEARTAMQALQISGKSATLAVAGVAGALAVGAIALTAWADETARAKAMTEAFADTLSDVAGVTGETEARVRELLAQTREMSFMKFDSAYTEAEKMGIGFDTLTDYVLGNADAIDLVNTKGSEYVGQSSAWEHVIQSREGDLANLIYTLDTMSGSLTEAQRVELQKIEADRLAGVEQEELADAYDTTTDSIAAQIPTLEELIGLQAEAAGVVLSERDAQRALQAAIDDATAAIEANGAVLDITTEAGRRNQAALDDIAKAGWDVIESMQANGSTQGELQASMALSREAFVTTAEAMGMSADEANRLADEMGLIPEKVTVPVSVDTSGAVRDVEALKAILRGIPDVRVGVDVERTGYYANRAQGGIVYGPGTSTSDSIPARLSNGEYVIKAAAVSQYGKAFFDGLNAQRFATGGYVGAAPSRSPAAVPAAISGPSLSIGSLVAADPRDAVRLMREEFAFDLMAGVLL